MINKNDIYTTQDEIAFLEGMGTWSPTSRSDRPALLRGYIAAWPHRVNWGLVAPEACLNRARELLGDRGK